MRRFLLLRAAALALLVPIGAAAQEPEGRPACSDRREWGLPLLGGVAHRQAAREELLGAAPHDRAGWLTAADLRGREGCVGPTLAAVPAVLRGVYNSAYAVDRYEGALWAGRGIATALSGGVELSKGRFRLAIAPEVTYAQNRSFRIYPRVHRELSEFANPWNGIDWLQRPGNGSVRRLHPGESFLSIALPVVDLRLSNESLWLGPALRYPLLVSNAAPGFPHLSIGSRPIRLGGTTLEASLVLGSLEESPYFDYDSSNDFRALSGFTFVARPSGGLSLGAAVMRHRSSSRIPHPRDLFAFAKLPFSFVRGEDDHDNGLAEVFLDWNHAASGLNVRVEWGREDFFYDVQNLIGDATYSHAYTLGLSKTGTIFGRPALLVLEATDLANEGDWYRNGDIPQGHTNRGEILGAYVGPGSTAQYASLDLLGARRWSIYVERVRWDELTYLRFRPQYGFRGYDVEVRTGIGHVRALGPMTADATAGIAFRRNRAYLDLERWTFDWTRNLELSLGVAWTPPLNSP